MLERRLFNYHSSSNIKLAELRALFCFVNKKCCNTWCSAHQALQLCYKTLKASHVREAVMEDVVAYGAEQSYNIECILVN
jgi:hypothetical protein